MTWRRFRRPAVMKWLFASALIAIAVTMLLAVISTVTTSARARKEATEAVLLAEMQASLLQVAVVSSEWTDQPEAGSASVLDDERLAEAASNFFISVADLQSMVDAEERALFDDIALGFEAYLEAIADTSDTGGSGSALSLERIDRELRGPILAVQLEENEHLLESIREEERAVLVLQILVPGLLVLAAVLSMLTARAQSRSRFLAEREALHAAKDEFVASVSHELRTPLSAVVGLSAELRDDLASFTAAEIEELASLVAEQSQEVALIVEDLLVSARLDDGNLTIVAGPVQIRQQIENALVPFRDVMPDCQVIGDATAHADAVRVRQILRNLIGNAVRHGGDRVIIEVESDADNVAVVVKDDGRALPESEWEAIFDAYHKARDFPGLPSSVGLGLTVARRLARQMSGNLCYRHADGWSRFELLLPAAAASPASDLAGSASSRL